MVKLVKVSERNEFANGSGKVVRAEGTSLAIFKVGEEYFAMNNHCMHRGGPLGEGELDEFTITCPWHGWSYDVRTGAFDLIPTLKLKVYPVKIEGDSVLVELPG
jgi:nitrite reductase/ring-hydroxylating ferredoxin subunit